jgi:succinate dehydrogenase/fumarate reductase flavoprotein subunit
LADLVVAGAGMAGLVAAAEARRLGAQPVLFEKLDRAGGSMRLSSGVVWRHRDFERFRSECPGGDERLQRLLFERLDSDLAWLESMGAPVVERTTGNELTSGVRFDVEGLTAALVPEDLRLGAALTEVPDGAPVVLATGGFGASRELLREHVTPEADNVLIRAAPGSVGDGLRLGVAAGASLGDGLADVYARAMPAAPARVRPEQFVALSQLYARHARVTNESGEVHDSATWSEVDTAQWMARQPRARAWFRVESGTLAQRVRERSVGDMVAAAEAAGAPVERDGEGVTVECVAGVTTTLGGLAIDEQAQAAPGVFACGADAGGIATGGYASGLAAALVFGRIAARAALGVAA